MPSIGTCVDNQTNNKRKTNMFLIEKLLPMVDAGSLASAFWAWVNGVLAYFWAN